MGNGCADPVLCKIDEDASDSDHCVCGECSYGRRPPLSIFETVDMQLRCNKTKMDTLEDS